MRATCKAAVGSRAPESQGCHGAGMLEILPRTLSPPPGLLLSVELGSRCQNVDGSRTSSLLLLLGSTD